MKKRIRLLFLFILLICLFIVNSITTKNSINTLAKDKQLYFASNSSEQELEENIDDQLGDIDFSGLDEILKNLSDSEKSIFNGKGFVEIVKDFISADDSSLYNNFIPYALNIIFSNITGYIPYFAVIIALAILYSLVGQVSMGDKNKSLSSVIHIVSFASIALIVLKLVFELLSITSNTISIIESQMEIIFPIILTLITAIGNVVTASTFQPLLAVLTTGITKLFTLILIPIFIFSVVFGVVGNISKNVRLEKFSKFFTSLFNWIVGIIFTIFIAFLTLHGLTVSSIDSISLKTAKFAIKSYIPLLGSYLSDGVGVIIASSVLIKNAIGVSGLVLLFAVVFSPIIKIVIIGLLLKLTSGILEMLCDKEVPNFLYAVSKSLNMLVVCLIAIGFMYLISMSILMCCSNIF